MSRKFSSLGDAVNYINDELTKRGYLKESGLKFGSVEAPQDNQDQLVRDKQCVNVIHRLLQRIDTLQESLKEQDAQLRRTQEQLLHKTKLNASEKPAPVNPAAKEPRVTKITKIQYREKDTRHLEAKVRKLQLQIEEQSSQLRHYADNSKSEVTWGSSMGSSIQPNLGPDTAVRDPDSALDKLSIKMRDIVDMNKDLATDLRAAIDLISEMNKTTYARIVLQIPTLPSETQEPKTELNDVSNGALRELARDWQDIKSQLP